MARVRWVTLAFLLAGLVASLSLGSAAAYWALHTRTTEEVSVRSYSIELVPSAPGRYVVYAPVPVDTQDAAPRGFALRVEEGAPRFGLVKTAHGVALSVAAEGPVRMSVEQPLPLRFSLDDPSFSFRQFKFWSYLSHDAPGPVLAKVEVRERAHKANWTHHLDTGRAIVVQQALEPRGWQVVRATQMFDVRLETGHEAEFPRIAMAAAAAGAGAFYLPLGLVVVGAVRRRWS